MIYGYDGNDPRMTENTPLLAGQIVVMACLSLFAAIAIVGAPCNSSWASPIRRHG
jgi:hypothetical protein